MRQLSGYTDPFISPLTGSVLLPENQVLLGDQYGHSKYSPTVLLQNLPNLLPGNIWLGIPQDAETSRPTPFDLTPLYNSTSSYPSLTKLGITTGTLPYVEFQQAQVNVDYAFGGEPFVVLGQSGEIALTKAQNLGDLLINPLLTPNILKIRSDSANPGWAQFELALPGIDFLTLAQLEEAIPIIESAVFANVANSLTGAVTGTVTEDHKIQTTFTLTRIEDSSGSKDNFYLGSNAGIFNDGGSSVRNTAVGLNAMALPDPETTTGNPVENVAVGFDALNTCASYIASARYSVAVGFQSQQYGFGDYNVSVGHQAFQYGCLMNSCVAIGARAMSKAGLGTGVITFLSPGDHNVAVGADTLGNLYYGSDNVAIGAGALQYATNCSLTGVPSGYIDGSVAIGYQALQGIGAEQYQIVTDGSVAIGHQALSYYSPFTSSPVGKPNIAIGYGAMRQTRGGSSNLAIGYTALLLLNADLLNPFAAESRHIAIGDLALGSFTTSPFQLTQRPNLAIGVEALGSNSVGRGNVAVGDRALYSIIGDTTPVTGQGGDFNTALGLEADTDGANAGTLTNVTVIGAYAKCGTSNSLVLGGNYPDAHVYYPNVGIGNNNPQHALHVLNTGAGGHAVIALGQTQNIPSFQSGHMYFYASGGDAYFVSDNLGTNKIGTIAKITARENETEISGTSNNPIIGIADNPIFPGSASATLPVGTTAQRPTVLTPGMIRFNGDYAFEN